MIRSESNPASRYLEDDYAREVKHNEDDLDESQFTDEDLILDQWNPMEQLRGRKRLKDTKISHMFRLKKRVSRHYKRRK